MPRPRHFLRCCRRSWSMPRVPRPRYDLRRCCRSFHSCINPTTEQTPATATNHATRYVHPSPNCLPSSPFPPRETSRNSFFFFFWFVLTPAGNWGLSKVYSIVHSTQSCLICKNAHKTYACDSLKILNINECMNKIKTLKLYF
jgi:hypothetical protein